MNGHWKLALTPCVLSRLWCSLVSFCPPPPFSHHSFSPITPDGRVAMLACVGWFVAEFVHLPHPRLSNPVALEAATEIPRGLWATIIICISVRAGRGGTRGGEGGSWVGVRVASRAQRIH